MHEYFLWQTGKKIYFQLPKSWQVLINVTQEFEISGKTVYQMTSESLANPIGTLPLEEIIQPSHKILIIADDMARPTPKKEILACLIDNLSRLGLKDDQIHILFATGTHRQLTGQEVEMAMGKELLERIRYTNHDCRSENLVSVGRLKTGGEIKVNKLLLEADLRIGIGSIIPHPANGYGGGGKIILPGVSGYETIREHHTTHQIDEGAYIGNIKNNGFYEEICEAARLANLNFIINALYSPGGEIKGIVAGHFEKAHRHGIELSSKELAVQIDEDADVSIVSAFPHEEGPQVMKSISMAAKVTKRGGTIILVARVQGGIPEPFIQAFDYAYEKANGDPRGLALEYIRERKLIVENAALDFNAALSYTLLDLGIVNVIMVSKEVSKNQAMRLGFKHADTLDDAVQMVYRNVPEATVNIFSAGGLTVPIVQKTLSFC